MWLSGLIVLLLISISPSNIAEEVQDDDYYDYYDYESTVDSNASTDCKTVG